MTLREMRAKYPDAFHPNQDWFDGESFMDKDARHPWPLGGWRVSRRWPWSRFSVTAADIAAVWLWVYPGWEDRMERGATWPWDYYLWTSDTDSLGQRIYVGQNGRGLELHRHIHLTDRFRVPV
jgi:hypothetical protein